jgi:hypothetical protein
MKGHKMNIEAFAFSTTSWGEVEKQNIQGKQAWPTGAPNFWRQAEPNPCANG